MDSSGGIALTLTSLRSLSSVEARARQILDRGEGVRPEVLRSLDPRSAVLGQPLSERLEVDVEAPADA